jgi:Cu2+-containing amine oxidase
MIIIVSNYECIFAFHFGQDASIHYEVHATGILSTYFIDIGDSVLAKPTSFHANRSEFAAHALWVTRYSDSELVAAG